MQANRSLPAIIKETSDIVLAIIENAGELPPELELAHIENAKELAVKVDQYNYVLDEIELRQAFLKAKISELNSIVSTLDRGFDSIVGRIAHNMKFLDVTELMGEETRFTTQLNPPRLIVEDETQLPSDYFVTIPETSRVDSKLVLEKLKSGEIVPGARMERGTSVRRKLNTKVAKKVVAV